MSSLFDMYVNEAYGINEGFFDKIKERREKKKAEKERLRKEASDRTLLELLNMTLKFVKSPYTLGDGYDSDVIYIIHKLGLDKQGLAKFVFANKAKFDKTSNYIGRDPEENYDNLTKEEIKRLVNGVVILNNDDYIFFLSLVDNKLYEVTDELYTFTFENGGYNESNVGDWEDYKEVSDKNGDILGQIKKIIAKYK